MVARAGKPRSLKQRLWRLAWGLPLLFVVFTMVQVLLLRWVDPVTSGMMLERRLDALLEGNFAHHNRYEWVDFEALSPHLPIALVAAEDQQFPSHSGFDLAAIEKAIDHNERGRRLRGGSTISQQVAKNVFLWSDRSWLRKGLEAWYTVLIEALWGKRRILEAYANVAEFGDGVYGAEAAARAFFDKPASALTPNEAARLAAVLPSPRRYNARAPGPYVQRRAAWIQRQMRQLGGAGYLQDCCGDP